MHLFHNLAASDILGSEEERNYYIREQVLNLNKCHLLPKNLFPGIQIQTLLSRFVQTLTVTTQPDRRYHGGGGRLGVY